MKRRAILAAAGLLVVALGAYWFLVRDTSPAPAVKQPPRPAATIGSGSDAIVVSAGGAVLPRAKPPTDPPLPELPLTEAPKSGQLAGPALQQARVLGAVPDALRRFVASSYYGESGVDVNLTSGIELRFGDASQAAKKWAAAAAVLADPNVSALDYVDLHAPGRPAIGGSSHPLPPAP
jgi:cell division septal protein FtsQ